MSYLDEYLAGIRARQNSGLAEAIAKTVADIKPKYIDNFSFHEHVVSLLVGEVQSGKTSHMFGLMCAAADEGFVNIILLTTDQVLLQQQTYRRAERDLPGFCICDENDFLKFKENNCCRPAVIVLKKNSRVLRTWRNNLADTNFCAGNPLFIVDDEADAASLNTQVNKRKQSAINKCLSEIKAVSASSIYMEVTGTPQSLLLQTVQSGWRPYFIYYFRPGRGYIGGDRLFPDEKPPQIVFTDDDEARDLLSDDEFPENGLKQALIGHLLTAAQLLQTGDTVCNFLIHPSVKTAEHGIFAQKLGAYLNEIAHSYNDEVTRTSFRASYEELRAGKPDMLDFTALYDFIVNQVTRDAIKIKVLNSKSNYEDNTDYDTGINIIVGGNSLGRGVTFPRLQTIYYSRVAKRPQADTMWQHARMFGYDRDFALMRVYMPERLYKLFADIRRTNNSIVKQIEASPAGDAIKIMYPQHLRPTRKNVLDKQAIGIISGGVNYFPLYPTNDSVQLLDEELLVFADGEYSVNLRVMTSLLAHIGSELNDWSTENYTGILVALLAENPSAQGRLIVRRNRDIARGTGTLLSPNDRALGASYTDEVVLTMYRVIGSREKGWQGEPLWIPNIKLPGELLYYSTDNG